MEAGHENKEADIDWRTKQEKEKRSDRDEAKKYGITYKQYRRISREATHRGIPFDEHWEDHKLRKRLIKKAEKKSLN